MSSAGLLQSITKPQSFVLIVILHLISSTTGAPIHTRTTSMGASANCSLMGEPTDPCPNADDQQKATRGQELVRDIVDKIIPCENCSSEVTNQSTALCIIHDYYKKAMELEGLLGCHNLSSLEPEDNLECRNLTVIKVISEQAQSQLCKLLFNRTDCEQTWPKEIAEMCLHRMYPIVKEVYDIIITEANRSLPDTYASYDSECWLNEFTGACVQNWAKKVLQPESWHSD